MKLQNPSLRKRKGFTLIELIVVIAILAILAALAIPAFTGSLNRAKEQTSIANIKVIVSAARLYEAETGSAPTGITATGTETTVLVPKYLDENPDSPYDTDRTAGDYTLTVGGSATTGFTYTVSDTKKPA